jgi:hypothetical protein
MSEVCRVVPSLARAERRNRSEYSVNLASYIDGQFVLHHLLVHVGLDWCRMKRRHLAMADPRLLPDPLSVDGTYPTNRFSNSTGPTDPGLACCRW